ncbi:MAG: hypothetical protein JNJ92_04880 [Altererythrobacter sp.]|nr:hypothetical protein [Altererythrobacter sp.]
MTASTDTEAVRRLTGKQQDVLERLARHQAIKTIADEMGVSETRVNQHIRAIKDRIGANAKEDLAAAWMAANGDSPFSKSIYRKKQLPESDDRDDEAGKADMAMLRFKDAGALALPTPWDEVKKTRVGPGRLDGPGATARRVSYIILVAIGLPVVVVLTLSAMIALTEMLRGLH